ncbi:MAG: hypothetical protein ISS61_00380 [Desulfobacteraceae bacterium]|nr:hypothetical protein [Desulfobacteraceae bacterium]
MGHFTSRTSTTALNLTVIAAVSKEGKSKAILGALRTGVIHILITDSDNALEVLRMID